MDKQKERFKWLWILDHLKSEHQVSTSKAELLMNLLSRDVEEQSFFSSLSWIRISLARASGLDADEVLKEFEKENDLTSM